jgi:HD superfamily phosphohydrolase
VARVPFAFFADLPKEWVVDIFDPLYGKFELPQISHALCTLPEVRRLSQVRLLNSITPTLATLSELRRYAHTLGVLHLFSIWKGTNGRRFPRSDVDALEVAIILHDVATPPFGHLFEYVLKESIGWDHESAAVTTLLKDHGRASTAQQIFAGRTPKVLDFIERLGIDLETVKAILTKKHMLSSLIFGVVDFDNLDNVWRMCWALGLRGASNDGSDAKSLASCLDVTLEGELRLTQQGSSLLRTWADLRRAAYNVIVFDQATVASQALLTHAITQGLALKLISAEDWLLHDESLLSKLSSNESLRELIERQYLGRLPFPIVSVQLKWRDLPFFDLSRKAIEELVSAAIGGRIEGVTWVYAFKERGTFEKEVRFVDSEGQQTVFGSTSRSLVISTFADRVPTGQQNRAASKAFMDLLVSFGIGPSDLLHSKTSDNESSSGTSRLDL